MTRLALFLTAAAATCAACAAPAGADTPTRVGVDQGRQVSFRLTDASVTVTLRPVDGAVNPLAAALSGRRVSVACFGKNPGNGRATLAFRDFTWKKKATSTTLTLNADVSDGVNWCVLERAARPRTDYAASDRMRVPNPNAAPAPTTP